jgi:hypothetical protein
MTRTEFVQTMAYSKEENGIVERANKEIMRHMRAMIFEFNAHNKWMFYLPLVERIINASPSEATGLAPAKIVFGDAIDIDVGFLKPLSKRKYKIDIQQWSEDMMEMQEKLINIASNNLIARDAHNADERMPNELTSFEIGSLVLARYPMTAMGDKPPTKFHTTWKGPFRVISNEKAKYTLLDLTSNEEEEVHVKRLKQYLEHEAHLDPVLVSNRDSCETIVTRILGVEGEFDKKKTLKFLVEWNDGTQTWEPWKSLRDVEALHTYLREFNLQRHIPRKFQ